MKIINGLKALKKPIDGSVLTIGVFDGVHLGHRKIIRKVVEDAKKLKAKSVVLTFDPHPAKVLHPKERVPSLISLNHRIKLIGELGVDILVVLGFSQAMASIAPEDFIKEILIGKFGVKEICVGDNFYFGKGGSAGIGELERLGRLLGVKVNVIRSVKIGRNMVSSSLIRKLITSGELRKASKFLGRTVSVLGTVIGGARLARELGYPTANLNPHHEVIPPGGVYAVLVNFKDKFYKGVLNIGLRPTFYAPRDRESAIEVHIFDFKEKIYGRELEVFFIKKLRDETAFDDKDELVLQIKKDEKTSRNVLRRRGIA